MSKTKTAQALTLRAQTNKYNNILFDSNIQESCIIEKSQGYEVAITKLLIKNYFV